MRPAHLDHLLLDLADRGVDMTLGPTGDTIRLAPIDHLDDGLRWRVKAAKTHLLDLLSVQAFDVATRTDLMRETRYHVLIPDLPYRRGRCFCCWATLPPDTTFGRCPACSAALRIILMTTFNTEGAVR